MNRAITALGSSFLVAALAAGCNLPDDNAPAASTSATPLVADSSSTFIVTQLDARRCIAPLCGGYFVKAVNLRRTICADGTSAAECHAFTLDFERSGIAPELARSFEQKSFATQHGLVRGRLVQRPDSNGGPFLADVLVVDEAWAGQAESTPVGNFDKLTATGRLCVTFPCDSYRGERLNVGTITSFNAVDLAASGAPADAVAKGNEALNGPGVLAAGVSVPIVGPAGRGKNFKASEFYLRVPSCRAQDARGVGPCARFFGYAWDGQACVGVSGCSCEGADCGALQPTEELCQAAHAGCARPCASSASCNPGEVCTTEDGECNPPPGCGPGVVCPAVCYGTCRPAGACKTDADCRTFSDYCTGCDCRALSVDQKDPVCPGPGVQCLVDPCLNKQAVCRAGRCALAP